MKRSSIKAANLFKKYLKMLGEPTDVTVEVMWVDDMGDLSGACNDYLGSKYYQLILETSGYNDNIRDTFEKVIAHEAVHVMLNHLGLYVAKGTLNKTQIKTINRVEEEVCDRIARMLVAAS
jgi:hypothetical protein